MQTEQGKKEVIIVTRLVCYSVDRMQFGYVHLILIHVSRAKYHPLKKFFKIAVLEVSSFAKLKQLIKINCL